MTATLDQTADSQPIEIERFSSPGLIFETSADLYVSGATRSIRAAVPTRAPSS